MESVTATFTPCVGKKPSKPFKPSLPHFCKELFTSHLALPRSFVPRSNFKPFRLVLPLAFLMLQSTAMVPVVTVVTDMTGYSRYITYCEKTFSFVFVCSFILTSVIS
jgi:hypothetical protein